MAKVTIVTACDRNYLWGAYLAVASLKHCRVDAAIHVLAHSFTTEEKSLFEQFDNVRVFDADENDRRSMVVQKPRAILTAKGSEYIAWMDADCIAMGDITPYLQRGGHACQIRLRRATETAGVFGPRHAHQCGASWNGLPRDVLEVWRRDVGENDNPAFLTQCVANFFVIHADYMDFVCRWEAQMNRVLGRTCRTVVDNRSPAYFMTDEAVLTSLLMFAKDAPPIAGYMMDKDPNAMVAHFSLNPKPWVFWTPAHLRYYDFTIGLVRWARHKGYRLPHIPWTMNERNRTLCHALARSYTGYRKLRKYLAPLRNL